MQFADALLRLLDHPDEAKRMGSRGHRRAVDHLLGDRHLEQWAALFARLETQRAAS